MNKILTQKELKELLLTVCSTLLFFVASAQSNGSIAGRIISEKKGDVISGATVSIEGTQTKTVTDIEGKFVFRNVKEGRYTLLFESLGFARKAVSEVDVKPNQVASMEVALAEQAQELTTVVVKAVPRRVETVNALLIRQKNGSAISDGISAETIRKSPDKNSGDVLKRVSGTSVQDNKFVIIRGLNERYNVSLMNNTVLPSTEPDKKAFAFDIIPSSLLDNIVVYKSPLPDLPADFAGGAIKVTTKDYPSSHIQEVSLNVGINTKTTFKDFYIGYPTGSLDFLGFFDKSRDLPSSYLAHRGSAFVNLDAESKREITKDFPNTFGYEKGIQSYPNFSFSFTDGNTRSLKNGKKLGYIFSIGYGSSRQVAERVRSDYQLDKTFLYQTNTNNYIQKNNLSALANFTYSYGHSKISWKTMFNNDFSKLVGLRGGYDISNYPDYFYYKSVNTEASGNGLVNSVLEGYHNLNSAWKMDWNGSFGFAYRKQPDQKIQSFRTPFNDSSYYYVKLSNENSPEIRNAGRVYSDLKEMIYGGNANFTYSFDWLHEPQKLKFGVSNIYRHRNVEVDALGYASLDFYGVTIQETKDLSFSNIYSDPSIDYHNLTIANIGTNSTDYTGQALMNGGYAMFDGQFTDKIKFTGGVRVERYWQQLTAPNQPVTERDDIDVLPSGLLTYAMKKSNFRLAVSRSVNRPEFRELANYSVYDFDNNVVVRGNPNLVRGNITNADLRYELFPSSGEIISASIFYKYFTNPIEQINAGNDVLTYQNANSANTYGAEIEIRKRLNFFGVSALNDLTFYANLAYIKGSVKFGNVDYGNPLQGQSPYLINSGLNYTSKDEAWSFNLLYNRIGPRLKFRAVTGGALNIFEKPRDLLDFQVSKKFNNDRFEIKLTVNDILAQPYSWYYKFDPDPSKISYDAKTDKIINSYKLGTTFIASLKFNI